MARQADGQGRNAANFWGRMMTDEIEDYPAGPGYRKDCEASRDGARAAAPAKPTQEAVLLGLIAAAGEKGLTYQEASEAVGDAIRPDVVRARLSCMKKARKVAKLPVRRMGACKVNISPYVLPQYVPPVDDPQGGLSLG